MALDGCCPIAHLRATCSTHLKETTMSELIRKAAFAAMIALGTSVGVGPVAATERLSTAQAIDALSKGGLIVYFRHFETGADYADQHVATLGACGTQRQLNEKGAAQAIRVRDAFTARKIPVADVLASPFCRAWQSADLAFGRHQVVDGLKLPPSKTYTAADREAMRAALLPLLAKAPPTGSNLVIMGHDDNMPAVGGPELKSQGDAVVLRPDGKGGFAVVAEIGVDEWRKLGRGKSTAN
jgi:hypothetical protein